MIVCVILRWSDSFLQTKGSRTSECSFSGVLSSLVPAAAAAAAAAWQDWRLSLRLTLQCPQVCKKCRRARQNCVSIFQKQIFCDGAFWFSRTITLGLFFFFFFILHRLHSGGIRHSIQLQWKLAVLTREKKVARQQCYSNVRLKREEVEAATDV